MTLYKNLAQKYDNSTTRKKLNFAEKGSEMVMGLRYYTERVGDGAGEPVLDANNGEELMHVQPGVSIVIGNRPPESPGTLYISTQYVMPSSFSFFMWDETDEKILI